MNLIKFQNQILLYIQIHMIKKKCMNVKKKDYMPNINYTKSLKLLKKSNSSSSIYLANKDEINKFEKMKNEGRYEIIKIQFPREQILNKNKIEYLPGKFEVIYPNKNIIVNEFVEQKNNDRNINNKQIINQENIIINNGFVNMNNNYYVNNNKNDNEYIHQNNKDKIITNNQNFMNENIFIWNNLDIDNNDNNNESENKQFLNDYNPQNVGNKLINNKENENYLNNINNKRNYTYNYLNHNFNNNRLNDFPLENNSINKNINIININRDLINKYNLNKISKTLNNQLLNKLNNEINSKEFISKYYNDYNFISSLNNEMENNNYIKENCINPRLNYNKSNDDFGLYDKNNPKIISINKNANNHKYNHLFNFNNNPQFFQPHFFQKFLKKFYLIYKFKVQSK